MSKTITILIGNSDDKLSQVAWSAFVRQIARFLERNTDHLHFTGGSPFDTVWQNACFVAEIEPHDEQFIRRTLTEFALEYGQDSIALVTGETTFLRPDLLTSTYPIRLNVIAVLWPHCDQWWQLDCRLS